MDENWPHSAQMEPTNAVLDEDGIRRIAKDTVSELRHTGTWAEPVVSLPAICAQVSEAGKNFRGVLDSYIKALETACAQLKATKHAMYGTK